MSADEKEHTRERLLQAATTLFARNGYDGTSVKELADEAGVNVSLISYHFGGKEGLYRAVVEQFGTLRLGAAVRVLQPPGSLQEFQIRLSLFFEELLNIHVQDPEICSLIHRDCELHKNDLTEDIFRNNFLKSFETLIEFFAHAQTKRILDPSCNARMLAGLAFGAIINTARSEQLNQRYFKQSISDPEYRKLLVEHAVRVFSIKNQDKPL